MKKFIPQEKLSKKARRALAAKQRKTWGSMNPVTRKPENLKSYQRKKVSYLDDFYDTEPFSL